MAIEDAREMWTRGDYRVVGDWFAEASRAALDGLALAGRRLLDVACGTGAVALAAARAGADVTGLDLTPSMLAEARRRAARQGLSVDWREGRFDDLSGLGRFDVLTSAFGVIFADDARAVAAELAAACAPGGDIALVAWRPGGVFGDLPPKVRAMLPPAAKGFDPTRWATAEGLASIWRGLPVGPPDLRVASVHIPFASVEDAVDQLLRWSGPWQMLYEALSAHGAGEATRAALIEHVAPFARPAPGGVRVEAEYAVARLVRGD